MQQLILSEKQFYLTVNRLCYELIENYNNFEDAVIIGIQPRGAFLANRICKQLKQINASLNIVQGNLDITFFRDDVNQHLHPILPNVSNVNFEIENKKVILVDDVLYTGRTIRAALDALLSLGRPQKVELLVLIDRLYSRQLPIQATYAGKMLDTIVTEKVKVVWSDEENKNCVWLFNEE